MREAKGAMGLGYGQPHPHQPLLHLLQVPAQVAQVVSKWSSGESGATVRVGQNQESGGSIRVCPVGTRPQALNTEYKHWVLSLPGLISRELNCKWGSQYLGLASAWKAGMLVAA